MQHNDAVATALESQPGYLIRRLQQIAVAIFLDETQGHGVTPVQFAALHAALRQPGLDQRSLAATIGFDTSTIGGVIDRLEKRGLIERQASPTDRRVRLLQVTAAGAALLDTLIPAMLAAQVRMLAPLPEGERAHFMALLKTAVEGNKTLSRAASDA